MSCRSIDELWEKQDRNSEGCPKEVAVTAYREIEFTCGHCGCRQFAEDTLELVAVPPNSWVYSDGIDCEKCGKQNRVFMDIER
jgi:predicted nucleic-acid-binding Zn-ribbon protein